MDGINNNEGSEYFIKFYILIASCAYIWILLRYIEKHEISISFVFRLDEMYDFIAVHVRLFNVRN